MTTATRPIPPHGSEARYQGAIGRPGCRCRTCITGWTQAGQRRRLAHLAGQPPKIPAGEITAHLKLLTDAGMSYSAIARAADVDRDTVTEHARGNHPTIRRSRAVRILAVRPEHADPQSLVSSLGTRRRIQTLYAAGHGAYTIAKHAEITPRGIDYILNGARATVTIATRNAISAAYRALADQAASNLRTQRRAEAEGWPGPGYWGEDDFEDPDFTPVTQVQPKRDDTAALRREEIIHFAWHGDTPEQILARLNNEVSISTVRQIVQEWRTGQKRQRKTSQDTELAA